MLPYHFCWGAEKGKSPMTPNETCCKKGNLHVIVGVYRYASAVLCIRKMVQELHRPSHYACSFKEFYPCNHAYWQYRRDKRTEHMNWKKLWQVARTECSVQMCQLKTTTHHFFFWGKKDQADENCKTLRNIWELQIQKIIPNQTYVKNLVFVFWYLCF